MKKILLWLIAAVMVITVCVWFFFIRNFKEPVFIRISNIQVLKTEGNMAEISAIAVFNNPNNISVTLINTELKAFSNDVQVGLVSQTQISEIPAAMNFEIPLTFKVDLLKLGMSQSISGLVQNLMNEERIIPVKFEGYCRIRNIKDIYKIPISYEDKLVFK